MDARPHRWSWLPGCQVAGYCLVTRYYRAARLLPGCCRLLAELLPTPNRASATPSRAQGVLNPPNLSGRRLKSHLSLRLYQRKIPTDLSGELGELHLGP